MKAKLFCFFCDFEEFSGSLHSLGAQELYSLA